MASGEVRSAKLKGAYEGEKRKAYWDEKRKFMDAESLKKGLEKASSSKSVQ